MVKRVMVGLSEEGKRCGETHPRARLTDVQVDEIRQLYEMHEDLPPGSDIPPRPSYGDTARRYGVSKSTVFSIVSYSRRCARAEKWVTRTVDE